MKLFYFYRWLTYVLEYWSHYFSMKAEQQLRKSLSERYSTDLNLGWSPFIKLLFPKYPMPTIYKENDEYKYIPK